MTDIKLRIFRQPTRNIQPSGEFHYDVLQFKEVRTINKTTTKGISGMVSQHTVETDWLDVPIFDADRYEVTLDN